MLVYVHDLMVKTNKWVFILSAEFSLFSFNNGMVVSSCRELDNNRSALSAASAFAIATAGANEGTPTKEKYRRMSLASTGRWHLELVETLFQDWFSASVLSDTLEFKEMCSERVQY